MKSNRRPPSREARRWLRAEAAEQQRRGRRLRAAATALAPRRAVWIREFLERIRTRGFDAGAGELRRVRPEDVPALPPRNFRVVF